MCAGLQGLASHEEAVRSTETWNIYDFPQLYEAAFCSSRNYREEVGFSLESVPANLQCCILVPC